MGTRRPFFLKWSPWHGDIQDGEFRPLRGDINHRGQEPGFIKDRISVPVPMIYGMATYRTKKSCWIWDKIDFEWHIYE